MRRFFAALSAAYLQLVLAAAVQIILLPFLLSNVGPEGTGVYLLLMSIGQFASVGIGWLAGAGVRMIGEAQAENSVAFSRQVHRTVFLGFVVYGAVFLLGCIVATQLLGTVWMTTSSPETITQTRLAVLFLGGYILITHAHQADLSLYVARLEQARANLYRSASHALFAVAAVPLMIFRADISLLFLAQLVSAAICLVLARWQLHRNGLIGLANEGSGIATRAVARNLVLRIGLPYLIFGLVQFALFAGDSLVIGIALGPAAVATYAVLTKVPDLLAVICGRISETLIPYFIRLDAAPGERSRLAELFLSTSVVQHGLAVLAASAYAFLGPWVLGLWVGPEHRPEGWVPYAVAGLAVFFQIINRHDVILHFACARLSSVLPLQVVEVSAKLLLTFLLFERFGFVAPLMAYVLLQAAGITWGYRALALTIVQVPWRRWISSVGARAAVALAVGAGYVCLLAVIKEWRWTIGTVGALAISVCGVLWALPEIRRVRILLASASKTGNMSDQAVQ